MKQRLYLILLLATVTLSGMAQAVGDAFYIYRNDGKFNAFFRDEVDSITYSHYDADSVYYDEMVTQLVHTQDSVYFIPLAAIDSVGFVQPETKLQPNVVEMEKKGLTDYLVSVEGMTLFFKSSIPNDLKPKTGDVLITTEFNSPLLPDGFVGKVQATKMQTDAYRVDCDSIYDIFDIFEQLISIEKIEDNQTNAARRVKGEWISSRNPLEFNLGYTKSTSKANVSLSGSVNGSYIATVAYNITRKEQYINLRIDHDWNYGANLKVDTDKTGGSFGPLKGPVLSLPSVRFAYIFKFQISGAPFIKGDGNIEAALSLNSPTHSYITEATFHNGKFSGTNRRKNVSGGNKPSFETAFSLNGSVQAGYMADFWLGVDSDIKGIAKDVLKLGTTLDFYIGPKINGNFTMKLGTDAPNNYYSVYKDSKLGISLLTFDYEFSGEASLAGRKFPKGVFCNGTLQTPLYHEWYIMPEFSDLEVTKDEKNLSATITCTPTRDIAFPLGLGIGLYDEENQLKEISFEASNYKRENEGFVINQTFPSLEREKVYEARPMIKILGGEVSATPTKTFKLEKNITVLTLSSNSIEENSAIVSGRVEGYISGLDDGEVGFFYNMTGNPSSSNAQSVAAGNLSNFADGEFLSTLSNLEQGKTYYYCAYLYSEGEYIYGESKSFTTPTPSGHLISVPQDQITATSAVIKCQFSNVGSDVECGIIVKGKDGSSKTISASNTESEQDVAVSGLKPATQYTCTSYVKLTHSQDAYYKEGNSLSFTTDLPDVTGTWTCKEKHGNNYLTYTVTLHEDRTVTTSSSSLKNYKYKNWSQSAKGLSVRFIRDTGNLGHDLSITFDDPTNPTKGTGRAHEWVVNSWGITYDDWYDLEMTK